MYFKKYLYGKLCKRICSFWKVELLQKQKFRTLMENDVETLTLIAHNQLQHKLQNYLYHEFQSQKENNESTNLLKKYFYYQEHVKPGTIAFFQIKKKIRINKDVTK